MKIGDKVKIISVDNLWYQDRDLLLGIIGTLVDISDYDPNSETIEPFGDHLVSVWIDKYEVEKIIRMRPDCLKNVKSGICNCGAKHTSRPSYHLSFCDLA